MPKITKTQKLYTIDEIFQSSSPAQGFFIMLTLSSIVVVIGLLLNDVLLIIGGVFIGPILSSIFSFALGLIARNRDATTRSLLLIIQAILMVILISFVIGFIVKPVAANSEMLTRSYFDPLYFIVSLTAGAASAFALSYRNLSKNLPGIAVSVSLIPPLGVIGLSIAMLDMSLLIGAIGHFTYNFLAVVLAGLVVFSLLRFHEERAAIGKEIKSEERKAKTAQEETKKALKKVIKKVKKII